MIVPLMNSAICAYNTWCYNYVYVIRLLRCHNLLQLTLVHVLLLTVLLLIHRCFTLYLAVWSKYPLVDRRFKKKKK